MPAGAGATIAEKVLMALKYKFLPFLSDEAGATAIEYGLIAAGWRSLSR
jgi:hypothetical protein